MKKIKHDNIDYLATLEKVKKQYQQYLEVSKLYELPTALQKEQLKIEQIPSKEHPLTSNSTSEQ